MAAIKHAKARDSQNRIMSGSANSADKRKNKLANWNSGVALATADCLALAVKHADIPDDLWTCPWKMDPKNPPVADFDEYLARKYGQSFDNSSSASDDDDNSDNAGDECKIGEGS